MVFLKDWDVKEEYFREPRRVMEAPCGQDGVDRLREQFKRLKEMIQFSDAEGKCILVGFFF